MDTGARRTEATAEVNRTEATARSTARASPTEDPSAEAALAAVAVVADGRCARETGTWGSSGCALRPEFTSTRLRCLCVLSSEPDVAFVHHISYEQDVHRVQCAQLREQGLVLQVPEAEGRRGDGVNACPGVW